MDNWFDKIVDELNVSSTKYKVGKLQQLRSQIHGIRRTRQGFALGIPRKDDPSYAIHWGGRKELQFNVGVENDSDVRFGVAFSFQPSGWCRFSQLNDALLPRIERFNEFLRTNSEAFSSMEIWGNINSKSARMNVPGPLLLTPNERTFVFLGTIQSRQRLNIAKALETFDELLPLYEFVESDGASSIVPLREDERRFQFKSGCPSRLTNAIGKQSARISRINLRHNKMQVALYERLAEQYGSENVGVENPSGNGVRIDVVVRHSRESYSFYEIKTAHEPRICVRQAVGQLLEYAYWMGNGPEPRKLVIVGPTGIDAGTEAYVEKLKQKYSLPIRYEKL